MCANIHAHTYTQRTVQHIHVYIHIHRCTYTQIHTMQMYIYTQCTHTRKYIHMYIYTHIHSYIHTFTHTYTHSHTNTFSHTHIHTHTHMYTDIHTFSHTQETETAWPQLSGEQVALTWTLGSHVGLFPIPVTHSPRRKVISGWGSGNSRR